MVISIASTQLSSDSARTVGTAGPPSDIECIEEAVQQDSDPIRAARRIVYPRGNAGGSLAFSVRIEYATLALAGAAAIAVPRAHRGLFGTLTITPKGGGAATTTLAHVRRCTATQQGCTIVVRYQIEY